MEDEPKSQGNGPKEQVKLRSRIAQQIKKFRAAERGGKINDERDLAQYSLDLNGLGATIDHVARNGESKKILDIGVGQGKALFDLITLYEKNGVTFEGTGLVVPTTHQSLPAETKPTVYLTPAEALKRAAGPYGAIISDFGLGYSEPTASMRRVDELLAPGGILKFSCTVERLKGGMHPYGLRAPSEFVNELIKIGYPRDSIFVTEMPEGADHKLNTEHAIIVVIKPGGTASLTAKEVYENDRVSVKNGGF